jgi:TRAP-type C4-dicarboxylate transport system substrate-binding protein
MDVIHEECAKTRVLTRKQETDQIAKAKANGIKFYQLPAKDMEFLRVKGDAVHKEWAGKIGADYLKKVQDLMGYKRVLDY